MKKILILLLCLLLTASITGCGTQSIKPIDTIEGSNGVQGATSSIKKQVV